MKSVATFAAALALCAAPPAWAVPQVTRIASSAAHEPRTWAVAVGQLAAAVAQLPVPLRSLSVGGIHEGATLARWPLSGDLEHDLTAAIAARHPAFPVLSQAGSDLLGSGADGLLTGVYTRRPAGDVELELVVRDLVTHATLWTLPRSIVLAASLPDGAIPAVPFGRLVLAVEPPGAQVFVDDDPVGTGSAALPLPLGSHLVTVAAPGWHVSERRIEIKGAQPVLVAVDLQREDSGLLVSTDALGARVRVDGRDEGAAPLRIPDLTKGRHTVEVLRAGYVPFVEQVTWPQAKPAPMVVQLRPLPGSLLVSSAVPDVQIWVDGVPEGRAPRLVGDLPPGPHQVRVVAAGLPPMNQSVDVVGGTTAFWRADRVEPGPDVSSFRAIAILPRSVTAADRDLADRTAAALKVQRPDLPVIEPQELALADLPPADSDARMRALGELAVKARAAQVAIVGVNAFTPFARLGGLWPERPVLAADLTLYDPTGSKLKDQIFTQEGGEPWDLGSVGPGEDALLGPCAHQVAAAIGGLASPPAEPDGAVALNALAVETGTLMPSLGLRYERRLIGPLAVGAGYAYGNALWQDKAAGQSISASGPAPDLILGLGQVHAGRLDLLLRPDAPPALGRWFEGSRWAPYLGISYQVLMRRYEVYGASRQDPEGGFWLAAHQGVGVLGLELNVGRFAYEAELDVPVVYGIGQPTSWRLTFGGGTVF